MKTNFLAGLPSQKRLKRQNLAKSKVLKKDEILVTITN
jgi:hypothetical protein